MWQIEPLKGKYYGTRVVNTETDDLIEVWLSLKMGSQPSSREFENGWTPDYGFDHVETQESYETALKIVEKLNEISQTPS